MVDHKTIRASANYAQLDDPGAGAGRDGECSVLERHFPCMEKCCSMISSISGLTYIKTCAHCGIWASLPDGASLAVTHILQCSLYGYDKRLKR